MGCNRLTPHQKTLICIYIASSLLVRDIVKTILDRADLFDVPEESVATKATAFWLYYWLTQDIWDYNVLNLPEADAHNAMDFLTKLFCEDFGFSVDELAAMLRQVHESANPQKNNSFLVLTRFYGGEFEEDLSAKAHLISIVQRHFESYHTLLHEMMGHDEQTKDELIADFFANYFPKYHRR